MKIAPASLIVAVLAAVGRAAPTTPGDDDESSSSSSPLAARQNNCSGTGANFCNFWFVNTFIGMREARIYDWQCREIGRHEFDLLHRPEDQRYSLGSHLPWTVELNLRENHFWYAGRRTDLGGAYCERCDGETCCRVAFQCD